MKQLLLLIFIASTSFLYSQTCTVNKTVLDAYIAPESWGIMPDTTTNLPAASTNSPYNTVLEFKLPLYADDLDPTLPHILLDNLKLINISGLPTGITFTSRTSSTDSIHCDNTDCLWTAGSYGCLRIKGVPTVTGIFPLVITLEGRTIGGYLAQTGNGDINGYKINITPLGVDIIKESGLNVNQNRPNPFNQITTINYTVVKQSLVNFHVINILGEVVFENSYKANSGENYIKFNGSELNKGIYFYTLEVSGVKITKRMIIE